MRDLFNAWNDPNAEGDPDNLEGEEGWIEGKVLSWNYRKVKLLITTTSGIAS